MGRAFLRGFLGGIWRRSIELFLAWDWVDEEESQLHGEEML